MNCRNRRNSSALDQPFYHFIMSAQKNGPPGHKNVSWSSESKRVRSSKEIPAGQYPPLINSMARSLVAQQVDRNRFRCGIFQQVYNIPMISNRKRLFGTASIRSQAKSLGLVICNQLDPSLRMACFYSRSIHFRHNAGSTGNNSRFRLCPAHSS